MTMSTKSGKLGQHNDDFVATLFGNPILEIIECVNKVSTLFEFNSLQQISILFEFQFLQVIMFIVI
jgi:hypothetical protein